ncbi:MAG TPA: cold-shock protein [Bauldia sp.]
MRGMVKFFNGQKGYGFITPDDGTKDVFVHVSALEKAGIAGGVQEGQILDFDIETDKRSGKVAAANLRVVR